MFIYRLWIEVTNEVYQRELARFIEEEEKIEMKHKEEEVKPFLINNIVNWL